MMLHHHTKIGNKTFGCSEDIITDILNLCRDFDLERSNLIFPQDTLAYDAVYQVWLQMDQQFRRYSTNSHIYK